MNRQTQPSRESTNWLSYKGSRCPEFNGLGIEATLRKFVDHFLPQCPITDPRGKQIAFLKFNFPKLVNLKHRLLSRKGFSASKIVQSIEDGHFLLADYEPHEKDRIQTIFWIPEVLSDPDVIYRNGHTVVAGDEVYIRVYDKPKPQVKVVFTMDIPSGKTVPVTSFLTSRKRAERMIVGNPLYSRK